jgi:hypothetical protein
MYEAFGGYRSDKRHRNSQLANGGREALIEAAKAEGIRKKAERDALRRSKTAAPGSTEVEPEVEQA